MHVYMISLFWIVMFVHDDYCQGDTTDHYLSKADQNRWAAVVLQYMTDRELDDRIVVRGHNDSDQNVQKIRDLITLGRSAVVELEIEIFSCVYVACSAWDISVPSHENETLSTEQKYDAEHDVDDDLIDLDPMLFRQTLCTVTKFRVQRKMTEINFLRLGTFSSEFSEEICVWHRICESNLKNSIRIRSNSTSDQDLDKIVFHDVILPSSCPVDPRNLTTSPNKRQIR